MRNTVTSFCQNTESICPLISSPGRQTKTVIEPVPVDIMCNYCMPHAATIAGIPTCCNYVLQRVACKYCQTYGYLPSRTATLPIDRVLRYDFAHGNVDKISDEYAKRQAVLCEKAGIPRRRHRHRHGHPCEDAREEIAHGCRRVGRVGVGVRVRVGVVECELNCAYSVLFIMPSASTAWALSSVAIRPSVRLSVCSVPAYLNNGAF